MVDVWVKREHDTQALVGACADYLLKQGNINGKQLHGLSALTWITIDSRNQVVSSAYVWSTKLPALEAIFGKAIDISSHEQAAEDVARLLKQPKAAAWVMGDTGFTNFYPSFRNTSEAWLQSHRGQILDLVRKARHLKTDAAARVLAHEVGQMKQGIPKAKHPHTKMHPQHLLTPLLFSLDPRKRFPVINGRKAIEGHLRRCHVFSKPLEYQFDEMVRLIGPRSFKDSAELDVAMNGEAEVEVYTDANRKPCLRRLAVPAKRKPTTGKNLTTKDSGDIEAIIGAQTVKKKRLHNDMTNRLMELYKPRFDIEEGHLKDVMFDVVVRNYNQANGKDVDHLLIEVKSVADAPNVRMAIGQVFSYGYRLSDGGDYTSAILLPSEPAKSIQDLLKHLKIGCLWFESEHLISLHTSTPWLKKWVACQGDCELRYKTMSYN